MSNEDQSTNNSGLPDQQGDAENQIPFDFSSIMGSETEEAQESQEAEVEVKQAIVNMDWRRKKSDELVHECYEENDLIKRAKRIASLEGFKFPHIKVANPKDPTDIGGKAITNSVANIFHAFDILFDNGSGVVPFPHYDTFRGKLVDHRGEVFGAKSLRVREIIEAIDACGLTNPTSKAVGDAYRDWALEHRLDGLLTHFEQTIPQWDQESRLECLVTLFHSEDTPLNRQFSKYFWLSLYNRIVEPGSNAPISLALIGGQDVGKSFFSLQLCWYLMGNKHTKPIGLDFSDRNYNTFLRNITGKSIIANVGEMTGFKKADINRVKNFVTQAEDELDFKFEDTIVKSRQWITIMDGNSYDGLQRDDTGNRRFYPMFVGQVKDEEGQPTWYRKEGSSVADSDFKVDYTDFETTIWQIMAECREWMEAKGEKGYQNLIGETSREVSKFSISEMRQARGVIRDEGLEDYLKATLICLPRIHNDKHNAKYKGVLIEQGLIKFVMKNLFKHDAWSKTMKNHMLALGFDHLGSRGFLMQYGPISEDAPLQDRDLAYEEMIVAGRRNYDAGDFDKNEVLSTISTLKSSYKALIDKTLGIDDAGGF